jgi:hypothetical protein
MDTMPSRPTIAIPWAAATIAALAATLVLTLTSAAAQAPAASQPIALPELPAAPGVAASAPSASAPGPRQRSPAETGNRATAPGDLRPERPVAPQISIPFGRTSPPAPTGRETRVVRRAGNVPASGGIDDAAARCEAQTDAQLRADCRAKLAREARARAPK